MIIPASVTDSITAAGIDVSNDWLSATAPVWNADYSAVLTQPISIAATPLADMRFLGVTTATITIRVSSAPLSLVSWSGIATLVADDATGGGSPIYPVHNSFTGRDVADTHPLASITGLVDALAGKAPAFVSDGARLFWATPEAASGIPSLRHVTYADLTGAGLVIQNNGASYVDLYGDGVSPRSSATRAIGIARDGRFALLNASVNVALAVSNVSVIAAYSDRVILSQKLQFNGVDTITLARGADFSTLKIGSLAGTLIGTAGNVSALSGTNLVLGNGTTIPQSTFATAGSFQPLEDQRLSTTNNPTFGNLLLNGDINATTGTGYLRVLNVGWGAIGSGVLMMRAANSGASWTDIQFFGGTTTELRNVLRWSDPADAITIMTRNDDGTARADKLVIPRSSALPISTPHGFNLSGGALQIAGASAISSARAGDLTALKVGALAGVLKGVAGDVAVASAGIDYTKPLDSVGTFSSISGTSLTAVYSLSIPGGTISNGGPCISFDFALNAQCVGASTETVSVYFGGALVGSFVCTATANTNFAIRLRGTMTWVSATSVLVDFWADIKNGLAGTYAVFNTSASLTLTLANPQTFEIRGQGSVAGNGLERFAGKVQAG